MIGVNNYIPRVKSMTENCTNCFNSAALYGIISFIFTNLYVKLDFATVYFANPW